jgi:hypothetical protein
MTNNDRPARIIAHRVFTFSRMAKVADLNKRDATENDMMQMLIMPFSKQN